MQTTQAKATAIYQNSATYWSVRLGIERALGILGESGKEATLRYLARKGIPEEEIPLRLEKFTEILREIFGIGAVIIEGEIESNIKLMESLYSSNLSLANAVQDLKERNGDKEWL
jgi:hypothetical protein